MRYQDWDVLLFPSMEEGAHVPVKEFRTTCHVEHHDNAAAPLLTTFIPALGRGVPFQISVHSWSKTRLGLAPFEDGSLPRELLQASVVVDGVCVCIETFGVDTKWPQIIASTTTISGANVEPRQLRFPPFHREIMSQGHWEASDHIGRIRIELSGGYADEKHSRFVKVCNVINFSFQPAPLDLLERNGIAWPNVQMCQNLQETNAYLGAPAGMSSVPVMIKHKKTSSIGNLSIPFSVAGLSAQPPNSPLNPYTHDLISNYDGSSRSTSAYSTLPDSAAPLLPKALPAPTYSGTHTDNWQKNQLKIRLPSDQIQMIINALSSPNLNQQTVQPGTTMPPPPLPSHATTVKGAPSSHQRSMSVAPNFRPAFEADLVNIIDRRESSRYSDVSMHPGCSSFPDCTTEDAEGRILHSTPQAPATVVRGRKEGSSPTKPRDFFSTILETTAPAPALPPTPMSVATPSKETGPVSSSPVDGQGRKRTRSALRSLNINDGSPEKKETTKPPRKVSKASVSSVKSDQEIVLAGQENQENQENQETMVLDA